MKKYIVFAIAAAIFSSCSFLEENPTTSLTTAYDSEAALESYVRGIITPLNFLQTEFPENLESCSGLVHFGATSSRVTDNRWKCIITNMTYTSMSLNIDMYGSIFNGINRCNVLLKHLPESPVNEAYKAEIEGEAKFYRALYYFYAVRLYGDVPLMLSGSETGFESLSRAPYYKVYDQIVTDLKDAFSKMRSAARVLQVSGRQGRCQKWAAEALLSTVYLQMASILSVPEGENFYNPAKPGRKPVFESDGIGSDALKAWTLAKTTSELVINGSEYRLAAQFSDLFKWRDGYVDAYGKDCWNNLERIIVYQNTTGSAGFLPQRTLMNYPPKELVDTKGDWETVSRSGNIRPSRFFFNEWCRRYATDCGCQVDSIYKECKDPRLNASLIHTSYTPCNATKASSVYPSTVTGKSMPYFKKYLTPSYRGKNDVADLYILRLAEIYYVAAEANLVLGDKEKALEYVNAVHKRAGTPVWTDLTQTDIIWDKCFELCGEDHSFFEVRRLGAKWFKEQILVARNHFFDVMGTDGLTYVETFFGDALFRYDFVNDFEKVRAALLCEFPKEELTANSAMSIDDKNDYSRE